MRQCSYLIFTYLFITAYCMILSIKIYWVCLSVSLSLCFVVCAKKNNLSKELTNKAKIMVAFNSNILFRIR